MSRIVKALFIALIFVFQLFTFVNTSKADTNEDTYFIVTAYYSPLPGQKHYITGSYWGDIKLNGNGHTTASGQPVNAGLLAGPSKYPFGTKIYFEGYGIGVIQDRGGAIVEAGKRGYEHDRIDIWMGYGDEGLMRAKKWGKRTIKGQLVNSSSQINIQFGKDILAGYEDLKVNPENKAENEVKRLQELFTKLGLYSGEIDGIFENIKDELINFQIKNKIISSKYDEAAGYYGPKTVVSLLKNFGSEPLIKENEIPKITNIGEKVKIIIEYGDINLDGDNPQKEDVEQVQRLFTDLELYNGKIDGSYENIKNELINFQKQVGLISKDTDWGAGHFGDKTRQYLLSYFEEQENEVINRRKIEEDKNKYNLEHTELAKLQTFTKKLENYINIKSNGSSLKKKKLIDDLKNQIAELSKKTSKQENKMKLKYIMDNIAITQEIHSM